MSNFDETTTGNGKWSQPGIPHKGWVCIDTADLGEPSAICEMCETREIRYVHYMEHEDYGGKTLACGCVCAGRMSEDYVGAKERETSLRNTASRRLRWLSRKWKTSRVGNDYINIGEYNIVIFSNRGWGFRIAGPGLGGPYFSKRYPTEELAKMGAFNALAEIQG